VLALRLMVLLFPAGDLAILMALMLAGSLHDTGTTFVAVSTRTLSQYQNSPHLLHFFRSMAVAFLLQP
jgi:hypothetical protein